MIHRSSYPGQTRKGIYPTTSVPSKAGKEDYQLGPIQQNLNYFRGSLSQNFQLLLKIGWFIKKEHLFYTLSQNLLSQFFKDLSQLFAIGP